MLPVVAIIGRPNVGKSTLFNRLLGGGIRRATESATPGTTRDRVSAPLELPNGGRVMLVDTAGLGGGSQDPMELTAEKSAQEALRSADAIIWCVDSRAGRTSADEAVAQMLRRGAGGGKAKVPVLFALTKAEQFARTEGEALAEFAALVPPKAEIFPLSARENLGTAQLVAALEALFPDAATEQEEEEVSVKIALVGRPNAGKSTLLNALAGSELAIVSETPGTTRDAVDSIIQTPEGEKVMLVDTAGLRKKSKQHAEHLDRFSRVRTEAAMARADVAALLIDSTEGVTHVDATIAGAALEAGVGLLIVFTKADLLRQHARQRAATQQAEEQAEQPQEPKEKEVLEKKISKSNAAARQALMAGARNGIGFAPFVPVCFVCAPQGRGLQEIITHAKNIAEQAQQRIPTPELNTRLREWIAQTPPGGRGTRRLRVKFMTQFGTRPPSFAVSVNDPAIAHFSFRRWLEKRLREAYGFWGTPIRVELRGTRDGRRARGSA